MALARARSPKRRAELSDKLAQLLDESQSQWVDLYSRGIYDRALPSGSEPEGADTEQEFDFFFKTALPALHDGGILAKRTEKILRPFLGGEVQILVRGKVQTVLASSVTESTFELSRVVPLDNYNDALMAMASMVRDFAKAQGADRRAFNDSPFVYLVEYVAVLPVY